MCGIGPNRVPLGKFIAVTAAAQAARRNGQATAPEAAARTRAMMGLPAIQDGKQVLGA